MKTKLSEEQKIGQELYFRIVSEAWKDKNFKRRLILDPINTLEGFLGKKFVFEKEIKVYDQSDPNCLHINIPIEPQSEEPQNGAFNYPHLYNELQKNE